MAEENTKNLQTQDAPIDGAAVSATDTVAEDTSTKKSKGGKKAKGEQPPQMSKEEKKQAKLKAKEKVAARKDWEDSIVSNKRIKREENRRKLKKLMLGMLLFAVITTSIVYVMLLFVQENNIRITANSNSNDKTISLSFDNSNWSPYLNANGPEHMWDVSYNTIYNREELLHVNDVANILQSDNVATGNFSGQHFIGTCFMLRNDSSSAASIVYNMYMSANERGLENAMRVLWGQSVSSKPNESDVKIYAALSNNEKLANTEINQGRTAEQGYYEYVAYPVGSDAADADLAKYEASLVTSAEREAAIWDGYFQAEPFFSSDYVLQDMIVLQPSEILYVFVEIWLEGSDFDCVDSAIGGYVSLGINFTVVE